MYKLSSLTSKSVVEKLRSCFLVFGFPRALRSDGGPQFCAEFREFCESSGILHQLSSPYNSRSNGSAESGVKAVKAVMAKCQPSCWEEAFSGLQSSCNSTGNSPASLFFGRNMRSPLPVLDNLQPLTPSINIDSPPDKLRPLRIGQRVRLQDQRSLLWSTVGTVDSRRGNRSYIIRMDDGSETLRNRRFLRPFYA